jgi:hypothetical protein
MREKKAIEDALAALPILNEQGMQTDPDERLVVALESISSLTTSLNQAQDQLKITEEALADLEYESNAIKEEYSMKEAEYAKADAYVQAHKDHANVLTLKLQSSNDEIDRVNKDIIAVREELTIKSGDIAEFTRAHNQMRAESSAQRDLLAQNAETISNMKASKGKLLKHYEEKCAEYEFLRLNFESLKDLACRCGCTIADILYQSQHPSEGPPSPFPAEIVNSGAVPERRVVVKEEEGKVEKLPSIVLEDSSSSSPRRIASLRPKSTSSRSRRKRSPAKSSPIKQPEREYAWETEEDERRVTRPLNHLQALRRKCSECVKIFDTDPKFIPSALQNLDINATQIEAAISAEFEEKGTTSLLDLIALTLLCRLPSFAQLFQQSEDQKGYVWT